MTLSLRRIVALSGLLVGIALGCTGLYVTDRPADSGSGAGAAVGSTSGGAFAGGDGTFADETNAGGPAGSAQFINSNSSGEPTFSFFNQFQVDPADEDTAGPKFIVSGDIDNDGLLDLASGWNQSQPVQIHLQRRDASGVISFETITLAGTYPVTVIGSLRLGDVNGDGWLDAVVAIKDTGAIRFCKQAGADTGPTIDDSDCGADPCDPACALSLCDPNCANYDPCTPICGDPDCKPECGGSECALGCGDPPDAADADEGEILILFSPADAELLRNGDNWFEVRLVNSRLSGRKDVMSEEAETEPELNSYTDLELGDIDGDGNLDIVVAFNPFECECDGEKPPNNRVDLYPNPGMGSVLDGAAWFPIRVENDAPAVRDLALLDVEGDGDLDIVATYPNAITRNIRWVRNPFVPHTPTSVGGTGEVRLGEVAWEHRPIGQVDTNTGVIALGDIDFDGHVDVAVRSAIGGMTASGSSMGIVQWFRSPNVPPLEPVHPPDPVPLREDFPWQVFTIAEFPERVPEALAIGDITGDGQVEAIVGIEGAVVWFDATVGSSVYAEWAESPIIKDSPPDDPDAPPDAPDTSTFINTALIVDIDGDGYNDVVATLDRRLNSGLNKDVLFWYRNNLAQTRGDEP